MPRITSCLAGLLLLGVASETAVASAREVVVSGTPHTKRKVVPVAEGRVLLFGPVKLTAELKETSAPVVVKLEGVTFDPKVGTSSEIFLVDAAGKAKLKIDPTNLIGSIGSMVGSPSEPIDSIQEINDFAVEGQQFTPRTRLKKMDEVFIAIVVRTGKLQLRRAVISTASP